MYCKILGTAIFSNAIKYNINHGRSWVRQYSIQNINSRQSILNLYSIQNINYAKPLLVRHYSGKSNFDKNFIIVRVAKADFDKVVEFFRHTYFNAEPTLVAAGLSYKYNPIMEIKLLKNMSQGMSLIAKCRRTGNITGAAINTGLCPWDPDLLDHFANTCTCPKVAAVMRFYAHISRQANLWEKFHEYKIFEVSSIATDINNSGKGVGYYLMKKSLELAKDLTYTLARVDATSLYTQKICKKLKMTMIKEIPYKSYLDCDGKPVFLPPPPHESVQIYVDLPHTAPEDKLKLLSK